MWMLVEINSFVWKGMKENQECTSGDYSSTLVGPPVKGPLLAPLAVYSLTAVYKCYFSFRFFKAVWIHSFHLRVMKPVANWSCFKLFWTKKWNNKSFRLLHFQKKQTHIASLFSIGTFDREGYSRKIHFLAAPTKLLGIYRSKFKMIVYRQKIDKFIVSFSQ